MPTAAITLADYRAALTMPAARWSIIASLFARLPTAMLSLALLLYVQRMTGSFATASLTSGSALIGVAVGVILQGRLIDRFGPTIPIMGAAIALVSFVSAEVSAVEMRAPTIVLVLLAFGTGLSELAVIPASRALWARLLPPGPVRHAAYSYEAISIEVFFILGPGLAGVLAATPWPGTGLVAGTACMVLGGVGFAFTPAARAWRRSDAEHSSASQSGKFIGALAHRGLQTVALAAMGFGVTIGFVEVAVPAAATTAGYQNFGGLLLSLWSVSSVLFGLLYGMRPWPHAIHLRLPALLAGFSVLLVLPALSSNLVWLAIALLIAGTLITPQATAHSVAVEQVTPEHLAAESFGWIITAVTVGLSIGQAISGQLVDSLGPQYAFFCSAASGLILAGCVWLFRNAVHSTSAPGMQQHKVTL